MEKEEQEVILKWKYQAEDKSFLAPIILNPLLPKVSELLPYSLSPNIISIVGLAFTVINFLTCMLEENLNLFHYTQIAIFNLLAFFFDAVDGTQGRKWKKDNRDVYVLTQLYDHGIDSITTVLNSYIMYKALRFSDEFTLYIFVMLTSVFIISSMNYKVNRKMVFNFLNNPTESVVIVNSCIILTGLVGDLGKIRDYIFLSLLVSSGINNIYQSAKDFIKTVHTEERIEIVFNIIICYYVPYLVRDYFWNDSYQRLFFILYSFSFHLISLNYICHEITQTHSNKEAIAILFVLLSHYHVTPTNLIRESTISLSILFFAGIVFMWCRFTNKICDALKMNYFWSIPKIGNNPYNK